jgi:hypothetical protein
VKSPLASFVPDAAQAVLIRKKVGIVKAGFRSIAGGLVGEERIAGR